MTGAPRRDPSQGRRQGTHTHRSTRAYTRSAPTHVGGRCAMPQPHRGRRACQAKHVSATFNSRSRCPNDDDAPPTRRDHPTPPRHTPPPARHAHAPGGLGQEEWPRKAWIQIPGRFRACLTQTGPKPTRNLECPPRPAQTSLSCAPLPTHPGVNARCWPGCPIRLRGPVPRRLRRRAIMVWALQRACSGRQRRQRP